MSQRSRKVQADVWLERFTLHDKKSMFRATEPPQYRLNIMLDVGDHKVIAREFIFDNRGAQEEHYKLLRRVLNIDPK